MAEPVRITFLGGLGEIGRNCAAIETEGRIVVLDCGQMFAGDDLPGVDAVLPDLEWLIDNADRVDAVIATHAHEDHIGALPYLLRHMALPIYGSVFTLGMIEHKLREAGLNGRADLRRISDGDRMMIGPFDCEFLPVTHSIPSGNITAFHTEQGVILHSSDFKLDLTPVDGRRTDLSRIGALAHNPGIRLMLADSTNADSPGASRSEKEIGAVLTGLLRANDERRVIVASFASHIHRLQQVADAAISTNRVVVPVGLSMRRNVKLAREVGILRIPDYAIKDAEEIDDLDPQRVCVVCTGSQGEPRAALTQMARGESRWLALDENDTVIFSAHPIPGNETAVASVRNGLARLGAKVIHSGQVDVHTSGHGKQAELKTLHSVAVPEFFVPVHGEYAHLVAHRDLAREMGMDHDHVVLAEDGDQLELSDTGLVYLGSVGGDHLYVDGTVGDLGNAVLGDRRVLGNDGFVAVIVHVDIERRELLAGPDVVSRGWVEEPALRAHETAVVDAVQRAVMQALGDDIDDLGRLSQIVRRATGGIVSERTRRRPMIVPMVRDG
ncbi:MAG: ribonuclease J [Acidimicrobiaceae bacterium]|nr:ribonuclease J [Acidimicrobiaceae bacterium]MYG54721.1 ribonuclease J [Acidimicrobiaceae bacterium]MYJ98793.1 ribonuclease J [Acidimicrobiaceae bacterium]